MRNEVDQVKHHRTSYTRAGLPAAKKIRITQVASTVSIVICAILSCASAQAESFGEMKVLSGVNEPLRAQLALDGSSQRQLQCAKANIESVEGESLGVADVHIVNDANAQTMLVTTRKAIFEPAVNVVVQTGCETQQKRVFPVLLDLVQPASSAVVEPDPAKSPSIIDVPQNTWVSSGSQIAGGIKLQIARSLSGLHLLSGGMGVAVASVVNDGDVSVQPEAEMTPASIAVDPSGEPPTVSVKNSGANKWMHHYWQPMLVIGTALVGLLILAFWRDAHPMRSYSMRKNVRPAAAKQRVARTSLAALDPIPYTRPDMSQITLPNTVPLRVADNRESHLITHLSSTATVIQTDNRSTEDLGARPPLYNVEEIVDEMQLAKLCMGLNQPLRALEILEAYWGQKQPNTTLPWQCMLELYRTTGDLNKYRELISRFNNAFGDNIGKRTERIEDNRRQYDMPPEEARRMSA